MESTQKEAMGSNSNDSGEYVTNVHSGAVAVVKGKRTKRQRMAPQAQPFPAPVSPVGVADSSSASSGGEASESVTEEEEDMANCLILLAQGRVLEQEERTKPQSAAEEAPGAVGGGSSEKFTSRRVAETATTTNGKVGYYVYECKTCSKCFPSFQALGGHRASHKKPKPTLGSTLPSATGTADDNKNATEEDILQISMNSFTKQMAADAFKTSRVHECSICGAEFNSGQALGGHMRRHRPQVTQDHSSSNIHEDVMKDKNLLSLDLNLPAPSDDDRAVQEIQGPPSPAFSLNSKRPLFLSPSTSALVVDCHY